MINGEETNPQFKERILNAVKVIVESGLIKRDGQLQFGLKQDMPKVLEALRSVQNESDQNRMRHSNDSLVNAMGAFVYSYQNSQMGTEKNQELGWQLQGLNVTQEMRAVSQSYLKVLKICLENMHERGFDKAINPRRWDSCGRSIGDGSSLAHQSSYVKNNCRTL